MDYSSRSLELHKKHSGKFSTANKIPLRKKQDLSLIYSPGVAAPCIEINKNPDEVYTYTSKSRMVAVVSDGSAVLGLGNIGASASIPVMEGKAALFKEFADIDAVPICLDTQDPQEIIDTVRRISPVFGGINLEDIAAPNCFVVEAALKKQLDIPVFHDDQHGTAIVVAAGLLNACKVTDRNLSDCRVVINGAGSAGLAIAELLGLMGVSDIIILDSKGALHTQRQDLNEYKALAARSTNPSQKKGSLAEVIEKSDVFIGVSVAGALLGEHISLMNDDPIVFALANPDPEILPSEAIIAGAKVVATGRSDYPNQVNNVLVFPGFFEGLLRSRAKTVTSDMKIAAAKAIASCIKNPSFDCIIPDPMDKQVVPAVAEAVRSCL